MGGRSAPNATSNPPGFFQMPEMSCGSKGRFDDGGAFGVCFCLFCEKRICVKANKATRAKNEGMKRYLIWRLPSFHWSRLGHYFPAGFGSLLLLLRLGPLAVVFRHLNFNCRVAWLYRERVG